MNRPMLEASKQRGGKLLAFSREQAAAITGMGRPKTKAGVARDAVWSADHVIGEALRLAVPLVPAPASKDGGVPSDVLPDPDPYLYCPHLKKQKRTPRPPQRSLYGLQPAEVSEWYPEHCECAAQNLVGQTFERSWEGRSVTFKPADGAEYKLPAEGPYTLLKPQPRNIPTIIGHVASFAGAPDDSNPKYRKWKRLQVRAIGRHYGWENVVTIVEHTDEKFGHLHAIIARPDGLSIAPMMACRASRDAAAARGEPKKDLGKWWRKGGQTLQNFFHRNVGRLLGWMHPRDNPDAGDRMTSDQVAARKQLDTEVQAVDARHAREREEIDADRRDATEKRRGARRVVHQAAEAFDASKRLEALAASKVGELTAIQRAMRDALETQQRNTAAAEAEKQRQKNEADKAAALAEAARANREQAERLLQGRRLQMQQTIERLQVLRLAKQRARATLDSAMYAYLFEDGPDPFGAGSTAGAKVPA